MFEGGQPRARSGDDADLVRAAQDGSHDAARLLFASYQEQMYRQARHATGSVAEADEVVAAACAKAWVRLPSLKDPDRFGAWISTILRNCVVDEQRARQRAVPVADVPDTRVEEITVLDRIERERMAAAIPEALAALSPRDREVLARLAVSHDSVDAVASDLELTPNHVYQVFHRARKRMRVAYLLALQERDIQPVCRACVKRMPKYVSGEASAASRAAVDGHLDGCEACRKRLAAMRDDYVSARGLFALPLPFMLIGVIAKTGARAVAGMVARTRIAVLHGTKAIGISGPAAVTGGVAVAGIAAAGLAYGLNAPGQAVVHHDRPQPGPAAITSNRPTQVIATLHHAHQGLPADSARDTTHLQRQAARAAAAPQTPTTTAVAPPLSTPRTTPPSRAPATPRIGSAGIHKIARVIQPPTTTGAKLLHSDPGRTPGGSGSPKTRSPARNCTTTTCHSPTIAGGTTPGGHEHPGTTATARAPTSP